MMLLSSICIHSLSKIKNEKSYVDETGEFLKTLGAKNLGQMFSIYLCLCPLSSPVDLHCVIIHMALLSGDGNAYVT